MRKVILGITIEMTSPSEWEISDLYNRLLITTKYADVTSMKRCIEKLGYDHHDSFEAMISGLTDKQLQIVFDSYDQARKPTDFKLPKPYFYNILPPQTEYHSDIFDEVISVRKKGEVLSPEHILWSPIVSFNYLIPDDNLQRILQSGNLELNSDDEINAGVDYWTTDGKFEGGNVTGLHLILSTALLKQDSWLILFEEARKVARPENFIPTLKMYKHFPFGKDTFISFDKPVSLEYAEILVCPDKQVKKFSKLIAESNYKHIQVTSRSRYSKHRYLRSVKKVRRLYYDA